MFSRPAVTPGAQESSGDRNVGIAMCRTATRRQKLRGSEQPLWGRIKPYGHCASRREIDIRIDAGVGANLWVWHWNGLRIALEGTGMDTDEQLGQPVISNGLPLTKLHHTAFDAHLIGIDPDFRIRVSDRLLETRDLPFLELGLKRNRWANGPTSTAE
jgi:hypothetical protein